MTESRLKELQTEIAKLKQIDKETIERVVAEFFEIEEIIDPRDTRLHLCRWAKLVAGTVSTGSTQFSYRP